MLWHKNIAAILISEINSNSIRGIRLTVDDEDRSMLSVICVYLPCLDQGMDCYREHLVELDQIVSKLWLFGSVSVIGDFNEHLGDENCHGDQNLQ